MQIPRFFARGQDLARLQALYPDEEFYLLAEQNSRQEQALRVEEPLIHAARNTELSIEISEPELIRQISRVLRLSKGHLFILLDGKGRLFKLQIVEENKKGIVCNILELLLAPGESKPSLEAGICLIKNERFEFCLEKLCELGLDKLHPLVSKHCHPRFNDDEPGKRDGKRLARWQAIAREASEQCERATIPDIVNPLRLARFLHDSEDGGNSVLRIFCRERASSAPPIESLVKEIYNLSPIGQRRIDKVLFLVGPEGGFSSEEQEEILSRGFQGVSLGKRILRSETAAIVAMAQITSILDI